MAKLVQTGDNGAWTMMFIMLACMSFHFSTLEEYYTGGLYLLPGNAVTDGSFFVIAVCFFLGFYGNDVT